MGANRGTEPQPEYSELVLSDCFIITSRRSEVLEVTKVDYTFERRMKLNYDEGKDDGIKIGEKLGEKQMLLDKIAKKISKGKSISQIADELEESEEDIMELAKEIES